MRVAAILSLAVLASLPLGAAELADVVMDDSVTIGSETFALNGLGLRKKAIIKVYVGGLYLSEPSADAAAILAADAPRHMVMEFVYKKVTADKLADGWNDCLEANTPGAAAEVKSGFEQLNAWMEDTSRGERLTFTYTPEGGTEVGVRGQPKGRIAGKPFADALFACWIGEVPATEALKEGLLGG